MIEKIRKEIEEHYQGAREALEIADVMESDGGFEQGQIEHWRGFAQGLEVAAESLEEMLDE